MVSGRAECSEASLSSTVSANLSAMVNSIQGWEEGYMVPLWSLLKHEGHCGRRQKELVWKSEKRVTEDITVGSTDTGVNLSGSQAGRTSNAQGEERLYKSWKQRQVISDVVKKWELKETEKRGHVLRLIDEQKSLRNCILGKSVKNTL